jgi:hypothetical protein
VSNFILSPGISPELTDVFVVGVPLALGLGYLFWQRTGFELALASSALTLGLIKLVTDYSDPWDVGVALAAILGGIAWILISTGFVKRILAARPVRWILGFFCIGLGVLKLRDFYDPFDLLLADSTIVVGMALWLYGRHTAPRPEVPRSTPGPDAT